MTLKIKPWHTISVAETLKFFKTAPQGLSHESAEKRAHEYGKNALPRTRQALTPLTIFLRQWESPLILLLVIASLISFFVGEVLDAAVIIATALLNAVIGFVQEHKANRALLHLKEYIEEWATVVRNGQEERIKLEELVPGDVMVLEAGDKIGADGRIIASDEFQVDEKVLTGESVPVHKTVHEIAEAAPLAERTNMCYRGTAVTDGRGRAVVVATGAATELGKIATLLKETPDSETPLQVQIKKLGRFLALVVCGLAVFIFLAGLWRGHSFLEMFLIAVAVAIAAVPEGLVISMTTILAIGMQRILKKNALVRRLVTAETLGSVSVIATDKTGTLTVGEMRVAEWYADSAISAAQHAPTLVPSLLGTHAYAAVEFLWKIAFLCNNSSCTVKENEAGVWECLGDTTEAALKRFVLEHHLPHAKWETAHERAAEITFSSARKFMAVLVNAAPRPLVLVKGAPEVIMSRSEWHYTGGRKEKFTASLRDEWHTRIETLSSQGLRLLACAFKEHDNDAPLEEHGVRDLVFVGIIALKDPLRPEVKHALEIIHRAGVRTMMITGDHPLTARAIGRELGMAVDKPDAIMTGQELSVLTPAALQHAVTKVHIFARVNPEHKIAILRALQANGEVVAMTGDGVNDAPALKGADIGVAVGSGTPIAKETADLILLDDNFNTMVLAVQEGRYIFENIKKVVLYLLSDSLSEVVLVVGALIIGIPLPILAVQILWVNLIEDSLPNIALAFDPGEREVMYDSPRPKHAKIFDRDMKLLAFIIGFANNVLLLGVALYMHFNGFELNYLRSVVFAGLAINSLFYIYSCRSFRHSIFHKNPFSNRFLNAATLIGLGLLVTALHVPLFQELLHTVSISFRAWFLVAGLGIINVILIELGKYVLIVRRKVLSAHAQMV